MNGVKTWWWQVLGTVQVVLTIALLCMGLVVLKNSADASKTATELNREVIEEVQRQTQHHAGETQAQNCALMQLGAGLASQAGITTTPSLDGLIAEACEEER